MNDNTTTAPRTAWALTKTLIYVCWLTFGAVWILTHPTFLEPAKGGLRIFLAGGLLFVAAVFLADLYDQAKRLITARRGRRLVGQHH